MSVRQIGIAIPALICMLVLTRIASVPQSQTPLIERIEIQGNRRVPTDEICVLLQSKPGDSYDENRLRQDLLVIYRTHNFADVQINEADGEKGKIITIIVEEKRIVRWLQYFGLNSFGEAEIAARFKEQGVQFTVDRLFDRADLRAAERELRALLKLHGKPSGVVRTETEAIPPCSIGVRFIVEEDPKPPSNK
jgi:outer membrane protein assembly factor BamA